MGVPYIILKLLLLLFLLYRHLSICAAHTKTKLLLTKQAWQLLQRSSTASTLELSALTVWGEWHDGNSGNITLIASVANFPAFPIAIQSAGSTVCICMAVQDSWRKRWRSPELRPWVAFTYHYRTRIHRPLAFALNFSVHTRPNGKHERLFRRRTYYTHCFTLPGNYI